MACTVDHNRAALILLDAGREALLGNVKKGEVLIAAEWPHVVRTRTKRRRSPRQRLDVFQADGFLCRYTGDRLFFPPYLTALSAIWPNTFPAHPNGKSDEAHDAYWSHFASVDHVDPISLGGSDSVDNCITTSMARNQVRSRYGITTLGWVIRAREPLADWDGGFSLFLKLMECRPELHSHNHWGKYLTRWHRIAASNPSTLAFNH